MFLVVHAPVGALMGMWVGQPLAAFALGVASHALLDIIPHGDEHLTDHLPPAARVRRIFLYGSIDAVCMAVVLVAVLGSWGMDVPTIGILAGISGGVLPDILQGVSELFPGNRALRTYQRVHHFFHCEIIRYESSFLVGMVTQCAMLAVALWGITAFGGTYAY
ncbi:hypothetical protein HYV74_05105 [Candidatus Uhrbacteria bacterium]|nr:hypothetical protein [Candidatus Uhrbacteria bacterium]